MACTPFSVRATRARPSMPPTSENVRACHKGVAEAKFTIGPVHVQTERGPESPGGAVDSLDVLGADPAHARLHAAAQPAGLSGQAHSPQPRQESGAKVLRMNLWFRIAHWGIMVSFPTLVFTGFALKYPEAWWARPLLLLGGHFALARAVHRTAAVVLVASTVYHLIHLAVNRRDRLFLKAMLPELKDATDLVQVFSYNLGLTKTEPRFAKFNYAEKMEYWAFMWGTVVMTVSGCLLWFNNFTLRHFPKWVSDAATAVHWYEALLATFSILHVALLHGDLRSARLPDGYGLDQRQRSRPTITAIPVRRIFAPWNEPTL
jgi:formate dehydrogenase gamma subunit